MLIDVAADGWHRPMEDPPGTRLRMEVDTVAVGADGGQLTGWTWVYGRRVLDDGSRRPGKALVRLGALPANLKVRHQGTVMDIGEVQQAHARAYILDPPAGPVGLPGDDQPGHHTRTRSGHAARARWPQADITEGDTPA